MISYEAVLKQLPKNLF